MKKIKELSIVSPEFSPDFLKLVRNTAALILMLLLMVSQNASSSLSTELTEVKSMLTANASGADLELTNYTRGECHSFLCVVQIDRIGDMELSPEIGEYLPYFWENDATVFSKGGIIESNIQLLIVPLIGSKAERRVYEASIFKNIRGWILYDSMYGFSYPDAFESFVSEKIKYSHISGHVNVGADTITRSYSMFKVKEKIVILKSYSFGSADELERDVKAFVFTFFKDQINNGQMSAINNEYLKNIEIYNLKNHPKPESLIINFVAYPINSLRMVAYAKACDLFPTTSTAIINFFSSNLEKLKAVSNSPDADHYLKNKDSLNFQVVESYEKFVFSGKKMKSNNNFCKAIDYWDDHLRDTEKEISRWIDKEGNWQIRCHISENNNQFVNLSRNECIKNNGTMYPLHMRER